MAWSDKYSTAQEAVTASDPKAHAASHSDGGTDEITVENLATSGASGTVPTSDGAGGLAMQTPTAAVTDLSIQSAGGSKIEDGHTPLLGHFRVDSTSQTISSAVNPTITDMGRYHVVLNVTAIGTAGTVRITGTSYDKTDGSTTGGDTEDITVGAGETGWHKSSKYWTGTVTLSGLSSTSVTADLCKYEGYHPVGNYDLTGIKWQWEAGNASNSLQVTLYNFDFAARTRTTVLTHTDTNITTEKHVQYLRSYTSGTHNFDFDGGDRMVFEITSATGKVQGFGWHIELEAA